MKICMPHSQKYFIYNCLMKTSRIIIIIIIIIVVVVFIIIILTNIR